MWVGFAIMEGNTYQFNIWRHFGLPSYTFSVSCACFINGRHSDVNIAWASYYWNLSEFIRVRYLSPKNYTICGTSRECFHFMRVRKWTPRRLIIVFHLVPYCRRVLFHIRIFVRFFPWRNSLLPSPLVRGSMVPQLLRCWSRSCCGFQRTLPAASWFINATGCLAVTNIFSERLLSVPFSGRSHKITVGAFK